jgi:hypothetical protein
MVDKYLRQIERGSVLYLNPKSSNGLLLGYMFDLV